jgi:hypothetical protein
VYSLVRGPWELRLCRIDDLSDGLDLSALRLRIAGWPVAGEGEGSAQVRGAAAVTATGGSLVSRLCSVPVEGAGSGAAAAALDSGVAVHVDAGPLGSPTRVPWLDHAMRPGAWLAALVELSGSRSRHDPGPCRVSLHRIDQAPGVRIQWPDGLSTDTPLSTRTRRGRRTGDPAPIRARRRALVSKERG